MKEILTKNKIAILVSDVDHEELSRYKWHFDGRYVVRQSSLKLGKRKKLYMHIQIMGKHDGLIVDHISGDAFDNRRDNLRLVTRSQNNRNQRPDRTGTSSQYKGVSWSKQCKRWRSRVVFQKIEYHLGLYESERDAAWVYNVWAEYLFGEYARLNVLKD